MLNELGVEHDILPSVTQLLRRNVTVSHLRHVDPEDLLGRAPEVLDDDGIQKLIEEQVVMVTGAGGVSAASCAANWRRGVRQSYCLLKGASRRFMQLSRNCSVISTLAFWSL